MASAVISHLCGSLPRRTYINQVLYIAIYVLGHINLTLNLPSLILYIAEFNQSCESCESWALQIKLSGSCNQDCYAVLFIWKQWCVKMTFALNINKSCAFIDGLLQQPVCLVLWPHLCNNPPSGTIFEISTDSDLVWSTSSIILYIGSDNERWRHITSSFTGWAHTQNDPST